MIRRAALCVLLLSLVACGPATRPPEPGPPAANAVAETINRYRARNGLQPVPLSPRLTEVAAAHVADLERHFRKNTRCNMHSWSANGPWTPCCYTEDHARRECMWQKPGEITGGAYGGTGYEIVAWYSDPISPERALAIWQESEGHHIMILNRGQWADNTWRAMGAAIGEHYAVVWFGEERDPASR